MKQYILVIEETSEVIEETSQKRPEHDMLFQSNKNWEIVRASSRDEAKSLFNKSARQLDGVIIYMEPEDVDTGSIWQLLKDLKNQNKRGLPFILITGDDKITVYQRALDEGVAGFLLKNDYERKKWTIEINRILEYAQQEDGDSPDTNTVHFENIISQNASLSNISYQLQNFKTYYGDAPVFGLIQGKPGEAFILNYLALKQGLRVHKIDIEEPHSIKEALSILEEAQSSIFITEHDLRAAKESNAIPLELYNRLSPIVYQTDLLKNTSEDLLLLVDYFLSQADVCPKHKENFHTRKAISVFEFDTINYLRQYNWPGKVEELRASIQFATIEADRMGGLGKINASCLPDKIRYFNKDSITIDEQKVSAYQELVAIEKELNRGESLHQIAASRKIEYKVLLKRLEAYYCNYPDLFTNALATICKQTGYKSGFKRPINIMIAHHDEDNILFRRFHGHLMNSTKLYPVAISSEDTTPMGLNKIDYMNEVMLKCEIFILLLSVDFLNSEQYINVNNFYYEHEREFKQQKSKHLLAFKTRPCVIKDTFLDDIVGLHDLNKPISSYSEDNHKEEIIVDMCGKIRKILDEMRSSPLNL